MPVNAWLRAGLSDWARELMHAHLTDWFDVKMLSGLLEEHRAGRSDHGKRLWALTVLALWKQIVTGSSQ